MTGVLFVLQERNTKFGEEKEKIFLWCSFGQIDFISEKSERLLGICALKRINQLFIKKILL